MLRVAMMALGATLTVGALAPRDAAAQMSGRERADASRRGGVIVDGRRDSRVDDRCYDDRYDRNDRYDRRNDRSDRRDDRYRNRDNRDSDRDSDRYRSSNRNRPDCDDNYYNTSRGKNGKGPKFCQNGQGHPVHGMAWCREKGWDRGYSLRNVGWNDVYLRRVRDVARRDLGRNALENILGRVVYSRFDNQRSRLGLNGPVLGDWRDTSSGAVLDLFANGLKFAQILDRNRDGRADVVLLAYDR